jgi:hypothetical protein
LVKVATPETALIAVVPLSDPPAPEKSAAVTVPVSVNVVFPYASVTVTFGCVASTAPEGVVDEAVCVATSEAALPATATMLNEDVVEEFLLESVAVIVIG